MTESQGTPTYQQDIRPMFRDSDRNAMSFMFDLWDYGDVKDNAQAILDQLNGGDMPCDGAWPNERVAMFKRWVEGGMLE